MAVLSLLTVLVLERRVFVATTETHRMMESENDVQQA